MRINFVAAMTFCCVALEVIALNLGQDIEKCRVDDVSGKPSYLWQIGSPNTTKPSYLFGTIHVPFHEVWSLVPQNSKEAFYSCDTAVFEIDFSEKDVARSLQACQNLPHNTTIQDVIPPSLYERIERHLAYVKSVYRNWVSPELLKRTGLSAEDVFELETSNWRLKKPSWLSILIQHLTKWLVKSRSVTAFDIYLTSVAKHRRKTIESIETVQEQCDVINGLNHEQTLFSLRQTLSLYEGLQRDEGETVTPQIRNLIAQYTCLSLDDPEIFMHNMTSVDSVNNDTMMALQIASYMHESMLKRNVRMGKRIDRLLKENPHKSFFFAFGGGHFFGESSVQNELMKAGYQIDRRPAVFNRDSYTHRQRQNSSHLISRRKMRRTRKRSSESYKARKYPDKPWQNWHRYWTDEFDDRNKPNPSSSGTFAMSWTVAISGLAIWYFSIGG